MTTPKPLPSEAEAVAVALGGYGEKHLTGCGCDIEYYGCGHDAAGILARHCAMLEARLAESERLSEYRLAEIKRLMLGNPHDQIVTVYGVPIDHYAEFLIAIETASAEKADKVLARLALAEKVVEAAKKVCNTGDLMSDLNVLYEALGEFEAGEK